MSRGFPNWSYTVGPEEKERGGRERRGYFATLPSCCFQSFDYSSSSHAYQQMDTLARPKMKLNTRLNVFYGSWRICYSEFWSHSRSLPQHFPDPYLSLFHPTLCLFCRKADLCWMCHFQCGLFLNFSIL